MTTKPLRVATHAIPHHAGCPEVDRAEPRYAVALTKARPWQAAARSGEIYAERIVDDPRSADRFSF
jgi:hypothetical protein